MKQPTNGKHASPRGVGPPVFLELKVSGNVTDDEARMAFVAVERSLVEFRCSFQADPEPNVVWLLNESLINTNQPERYAVTREHESSGRPILNFTETLTIMSAVLSDSGNYTCIGSNIHGNSQAMDVLDVIGEASYLLQCHNVSMSLHPHTQCPQL